LCAPLCGNKEKGERELVSLCPAVVPKRQGIDRLIFLFTSLSLSFGRRELRGGGEERMSKKEAKQKALYPGATHGQKAPNCDFYVSLLPSPWGEGKSMRNCCC